MIFSSIHAKESILDKLAKEDIARFNGYISGMKKYQSIFPQLTKRYNAGIKRNQSQIDSINNLMKNDRSTLYKNIVNAQKQNIKKAKKILKAWETRPVLLRWFGPYWKALLKGSKKNIELLDKEHKKANSAITSKFDAWQKKSKKEPTKTTLKKDTKDKNKIKLSTANKGKTTLESSNLTTTVKTNNINVTGKASVGAVTIGKEEK